MGKLIIMPGGGVNDEVNKELGVGIPPLPPKLFKVNASDGKNRIYIEGPDDTVIDDQELCRAAGVLVLRKEGGYPTDETDKAATKVLDLKREQFEEYVTETFEDANLTNNKKYYYAAFSYSDHDVYNRDESPKAEVTPSNMAKLYVNFTSPEAIGCKIVAKKDTTVREEYVDNNKSCTFELDSTGEWRVGGQVITVSTLGEEKTWNEKIWGYDWELSEPDTEKSITYPTSVDNAKFTPVPERGEDAVIDLGDWQEFHDWLKCRPVMLNFNGTVAYELNHNDQTKKKDNTNSDISDGTKDMNAMVEFPKKYMKRWTDENNIAHFRICNLKLSDDYKCYPWMYGTTEDVAKENDFIYLAMFEGSNISGKMRSIATNQIPTTNQPGATELQQVQALGNNGWQYDDFADESFICDLMFMMGRSTNAQKHFGNGHYQAAHASQASSLNALGLLKSYGPYYGGTGNTGIKFLWLENYYSDRWTKSFGLCLINNVFWIKNFPPYSSIDFTQVTENNGWKNLNRGITGTTNSTISEVTYDENGMLIKKIDGTQNTGVPDSVYYTASGKFNLLWGQVCNSGYNCGPGAVAFIRDLSYGDWGTGITLAYKQILE